MAIPSELWDDGETRALVEKLDQYMQIVVGKEKMWHMSFSARVFDLIRDNLHEGRTKGSVHGRIRTLMKKGNGEMKKALSTIAAYTGDKPHMRAHNLKTTFSKQYSKKRKRPPKKRRRV